MNIAKLVSVGAYSAALSVTRLALVASAPLLVLFQGKSVLAGWAVAVSLAPMFTALVDMSLSRTLVRIMVEWERGERGRTRNDLFVWFFRLRLRMYLISIPLIFGVSWFFWPYLSGGKIAAIPYLPALIVFGLAEANSLWLTSVARVTARPVYLLLVRTAQALAACAGALFVPLLWRDFDSFSVFSFVYLISSFLGVFFAGGISCNDFLRAKVKGPRVKRVLLYSLPLAVHDLSWWLRGSAVVLIVANHYDALTVGAYFLSSLFITPIAIVLAGCDQAFALDYYRARNNGNILYNAVKPYRIAISASFVAFVVVVSSLPLIDKIVAAETAKVLVNTLPFGMAGIVFHSCYILWVKNLLYAERTVIILIGSVGISLFGLALCSYAAVQWGIKGVAASAALTFLLLAVYVLCLSWVLDNERPLVAFPLGIIVGTIAVLCYASIGVGGI